MAVLALVAGSLAALLLWTAPAGTDFAAHAYQRGVYLQSGFRVWDNFWYAGHYTFVTYSILYYPLAGLVGIRLLAVTTAAVGAMAFGVVLARRWGRPAQLASLTFAVVWGAYILTAAFPFALGMTLALLAVAALQSGRRWRFALVTALTLAASPLAFLMLALVLAGIALAERVRGGRLAWPAVTIIGWGCVEVLLWRMFPSGGRYPFSVAQLLQGLAFCAAIVLVTWRVKQARPLSFIFLVIAAGCIAAYLVPSGIGQNMLRFRFVALPVTVLALSLRHWRPRLISFGLLGLVLVWNLSPLVFSFANGRADSTADAAYWRPAVRFLHTHLTPSYRVEVVGTGRHWEAAYLPRAGIPLTRGWFRQDDFPQNEVLYDWLTPAKYVAWLHSLGVRFVVLTNAKRDYSARAEAALVRSGRSHLRPVFRNSDLEILRVPSAHRLVTGPGPARVLSLSRTRLVLRLGRPGSYDLAIRYSPYWQGSAGCIAGGPHGMTRLTVARAGIVSMRFRVGFTRALEVLATQPHGQCAVTTTRTPGFSRIASAR